MRLFRKYKKPKYKVVHQVYIIDKTKGGQSFSIEGLFKTTDEVDTMLLMLADYDSLVCSKLDIDTLHNTQVVSKRKGTKFYPILNYRKKLNQRLWKKV